MAKKQLPSNILAYLTNRANQGLGPVGADDITTQMGEKRPTVNRYLATLVADFGGVLLRAVRVKVLWSGGIADL